MDNLAFSPLLLAFAVPYNKIVRSRHYGESRNPVFSLQRILLFWRPPFLVSAVSACSVYIAPVSNFHNYYQQNLILNFVNDPVYPLTYSVSFPAGQPLASGAARVFRQFPEALQNPRHVPLGNITKILGY
jgi:hypothetical protein